VPTRSQREVARANVRLPFCNALSSGLYVLDVHDVANCGNQCNLYLAALLGRANEHDIHALPNPLSETSELTVSPAMFGIVANPHFKNHDAKD
jgi:hypothetical protein